MHGQRVRIKWIILIISIIHSYVKFFGYIGFDFFNLALWLSLGCVYFTFDQVQRFIPQDQLDTRVITHFILSVVCVGWFWIRLRHYTYRKPFWYELKEIFRTIVIFAIFDLALIAFTKWQFSRYVWVFCWTFAIIPVPFFRALTKHLLNKLGIWKKKLSSRERTECSWCIFCAAK